MKLTATTSFPTETDADTIAGPGFEGEGIAHDFEDGHLGNLVERGEARTGVGSVAVTHAGDLRFLIYGLGKRDKLDGEQARRAAAAVETKARALGAAKIAVEIPHHANDEVVEGLAEGVLLAAYRWDTRKSDDPDRREPASEVILPPSNAPTTTRRP